MNEKLLADYLTEIRGLGVKHYDIDSFYIYDYVIKVSTVHKISNNDEYEIGLLDIIAWVYSKRGKCNRGGKIQ